jgi:uncharacterized protein YacL
MDILIILLLIAILGLLLMQSSMVQGGKLAVSRRRKIILDSCALIDGRIVDLVRTGFVADQLIIPKFVLSELQLLADGNDAHKRERARFGLDIAAQLQEYIWAPVRIDQTQIPGGTTDDKLIKLAKKLRAVLCTTDFNLNKVSTVEGVKILNVNELAQTLRPIVLPGEQVKVKVLQKGSNNDQGVGYLDDGTMIVVDGAAKAIGTEIMAVVDRMHQTVAGKMVFARLKGGHTAPTKPKAILPSRMKAAEKPLRLTRPQLLRSIKPRARKKIQ